MTPAYCKKYDIAVVGAGIAGVAAALAAARAGRRVALVEKTVFTGGLATAGLIYIYLPLCDGNGHQVTFGIAEELFKRSIDSGLGDEPPNWRAQTNGAEAKRYRTLFAPAAFILTLDEALRQAGVEVWLDTLCCLPVMDGDRMTAVEVENKSGRGRLAARAFVDCTGDADIACRAGAPCADGQNYLTIWALSYFADAATQSAGPGFEHVRITALGGGPAGHGQPAGSRTYSGISGEAVSHFTLASRRLLLEYWRKQHASGRLDRHTAWPVSLPALPQFRMTRHIVGRTVMTDGQSGRPVADSIGLYADWRKPGFVWEVPFSALAPQRVKGLLAAGRCMSCAGDAWDVMRVIPAAALTGEVAGLACALAQDDGVEPAEINVLKLQKKLRGMGFPLHLPDIGLGYQAGMPENQ